MQHIQLPECDLRDARPSLVAGRQVETFGIGIAEGLDRHAVNF